MSIFRYREKSFDKSYRFCTNSKNGIAYLGAEAAEESVPKVAESKCKIFVKEISQKFAHPEN
jgi:hypothetical protein